MKKNPNPAPQLINLALKQGLKGTIGSSADQQMGRQPISYLPSHTPE